jgi:uncharacterized protein YdeI (YjbR/CyaY-like superfamily)
MVAIHVNANSIHEFEDADAFYRWLGEHCSDRDEIWIKIHKVRSGLKSITPKEAIDVALCWGWIDGIRKGWDDKSFLQRYTPRSRKSTWSQINVDNVARLIGEGRMTEHGLRQVELAKVDGRWSRAYKSGAAMVIPDDLRVAIDAAPAAKDMFEKLSAQNRYALAYQVHNMITGAGRKRKIETFVGMLEQGKTIYPQREK